MWWLKNRPIMPPQDGLRHVGNFAGLVLYREGQFQVQLFIAKPETTVPHHMHRNVESYELQICGDIAFCTTNQEYSHGMLHIDSCEDHAAFGTGKSGVAFYSFQKWLNGIAPSSVDLDWIGDPMTSEHVSEIRTS
jgi:hypothetical protein